MCGSSIRQTRQYAGLPSALPEDLQKPLEKLPTPVPAVARICKDASVGLLAQ